MKTKLHGALLKGSIILLISFGVFNFLNFLFHFSMARMLSVADYGIVAALFSIIYLMGVLTESVQTVITKYVSREKQNGKIKNILKRSMKKGLFYSLIFFICYSLASVALFNILKIPLSLLLLTGLLIFTVFILPVTRGIIQGKKRFAGLGWNMIGESLLKIVISIALVYVGFKTFGAMLGVVLGSFSAFALSFISLRDVVSSKEARAETQEIYGYTRPTFLIVLTIVAFYSIDVLIAKIVFSPEVAGTYSIAATLSKTFLFGIKPISRVMFSFSSGEKNKKKDENIFANSIFLSLVLIICGLALFYFFPELIILLFSGKSLAEASLILFYLGIAASLLAITDLVLNYKLAIDKTKGYKWLPLFVLIEVALLFIFSANLWVFSLAFLTSSAIFLWGSIFLLNK